MEFKSLFMLHRLRENIRKFLPRESVENHETLRHPSTIDTSSEVYVQRQRRCSIKIHWNTRLQHVQFPFSHSNRFGNAGRRNNPQILV